MGPSGRGRFPYKILSLIRLLHSIVYRYSTHTERIWLSTLQSRSPTVKWPATFSSFSYIHPFHSEDATLQRPGSSQLSMRQWICESSVAPDAWWIVADAVRGRNCSPTSGGIPWAPVATLLSEMTCGKSHSSTLGRTFRSRWSELKQTLFESQLIKNFLCSHLAWINDGILPTTSRTKLFQSSTRQYSGDWSRSASKCVLILLGYCMDREWHCEQAYSRRRGRHSAHTSNAT